ncbi:Hypothetical protein FNO222_0422 [Francisella orientalis]|uniref:Uncharacterized protein n=1 Tax=Francisella orientalis TaxID=299583 RepID=A0ABN4GYC0_9GAMM|nr:hypothetical protein FNO12_0420 [Francisella orientalis FNO12]AKN86714.1 Hypothetical protein FNO24_0420 [Francisella orientalis FNO24]AKN88253.1 Hypothetical protein FNO190_0420 [Francisella orientalis]AKU05007.1 Hypothetical protein FNO01_0420 [Francisella orientalis]QEN19916.1 Hypothetical protein FNO39_0422 [Francisella orientalis]
MYVYSLIIIEKFSMSMDNKVLLVLDQVEILELQQRFKQQEKDILYVLLK